VPEAWDADHWQQLSFPEVENLFVVAAELPASGTANKIYLVPSGESGDNQFVEWAWIGGVWENLGSVTIDLSGYYTKEEIDDVFVAMVNGRATDSQKNVDVTVDMTKAEFDALEDPPGSGLYPSLKGQIVRISDEEPYDGVLVPFPDYANMETANRISTAGGTWTADRDGYVELEFSRNADAADGATPFFINEKRVGGLVRLPYEGYTDQKQVAKGDVIKSSTAHFGSCGCYFIPEKWVLRRPPVQVIEGNGSYSTDEIDTGQVWHNGKPIYRRVFTGTFNMTGGTVRDTIIFFANATWLDCVTDSGGWVEAAATNHARCAINSRMVTDGAAMTSYVIESCVRFTQGITLQMNLSGSNPITGGLYECWVEYTKL
jgi:hypothetical protein